MAIVLDQFSQILFATATTQFFIVISLVGLLFCSSYVSPENHEPANDGIPRKIFMSTYIILLVLILNLSGGDSHLDFNITSVKFWFAMIVMNMDLINKLFGGEQDSKQSSSH